MRVETETVTGQDAAEVSTEKPEQVATEIDEPEGQRGGRERARHRAYVESEETSSEGAETGEAEDVEPQARWRQIKWSRLLAFGVLPVLALVIAAAAGFRSGKTHGFAGPESPASSPLRRRKIPPWRYCPTSPIPSTRIWRLPAVG